MVAGPMSSLGSLAVFKNRDETPQIGTRFLSDDVQLSRFLAAPNADELIRDLAVLVSNRGVVFFPEQDISIEEQKRLALRMGELTGKPASSGLHKHPVTEYTKELGNDVAEISSISGFSRFGYVEGQRASDSWHSDITFEPVPSAYAILKMHTVPEVGGDTLWASGYEAYDRLSPAYRRFLESLHAVHDGSFFNGFSKRTGIPVQDNRGSPENTGNQLTAIHPVIRTHPVTGFKTLFVNKGFTKRIVELTPDESADVLNFLFNHISQNHDFQVRFRWNKNDVGIWDNRSVFHAATNDYGDSLRVGNRVVVLGEKPYFDPKSKSRREVLSRGTNGRDGAQEA